jgi:DNA ligase (NAD+)
MVERAVETDPHRPAFEIPRECPACGSEVRTVKEREAEFLECSTPQTCVVARLRELQHFAKIVGLDGYGPKILAKAVDAGLLTGPADFYRLTVDELAAFERLGRRSAQNLVDQVEAHREIALPVFLQALGIEHLGRQYAQLLAEAFGTLDRVRAATREQLLELRGIKDAIADAIVEGLARRSDAIDELVDQVSVPALERAPTPTREGRLAGKSFLFTGALSELDRKTAQQRVQALGGIAASSVTKSLDYLVLGGEGERKSSKLERAERLIAEGAPLKILSEREFVELIEDAS